jgi:hypothetical protein
MSTAAHPPDAHGVRSEADHVPVLRLALVGLVALFIFFLGSLAAVAYLHVRQVERGPVAVPPEIGLSKIGLVEQQLFDLSVRGERARARQREHLGSAGWVDRRAGLAHIPIEEAMKLVAAGVRPAPAGGGAPAGGQP